MAIAAILIALGSLIIRSWQRNLQAAALLHKEQALSQSYLDAAQSIMVALDTKGCITMINRRGCELLGRPSTQLLGHNWFAACLHQPDGMNIAYPAFQKIMAGDNDATPRHESTIAARDASQRLIVWHNTYPSNDDGAITGVLSSGEDITLNQQTEQAHRIAAVAFESQQGMMITDAHGVILRVNKSFTEITGYNAMDVIGQNPRMMQSDRQGAGFYKAMWREINNTGFWQGEICNRRKSGDLYTEWINISAVKSSAGVVTHFVGAFSDISERKASAKRIEHLAFYDALTDLPNRALLRNRLEHTLIASSRRQCQAALLYIDLDNFKTINDTLGHEKGDEIIRQAAHRLRACARASDTLARIGGDEFIMLLEDPAHDNHDLANQVRVIGEKILTSLRQPYQLDQIHHHSSASIGITLFDGKHHIHADEPLRQSELAMYQAKGAGRNTLCFFDPQIQAAVRARTHLESRLREAVASNQFILHYQPQMDDQGRITGAEALVRWIDPKRGMISPADFIPLAESNGLILPLGQWVMETACQQLTAWANDPILVHLNLSVNVSAHQLKQGTFVERILDTLRRSGAAPGKLKLELTESMLADDIEGAITKMGILKGCGVNFSLDDFGTGYSSLAYLKRLPLAQLKIDQGFVRDILVDGNDAAIAKMIIALAASMGLDVIAEGVETPEQRDFLLSAGCHAFQGYVFSKPLPLLEFEQFSRTHEVARQN